ncbi:hypothetical protein ACFV19_20890 [Streptomyces griseoluteus]|uniref:hypothetical protein n=1 Tax=Streptomyces griseoluteus TaxID=29306 RepID=UPI0036A20C5A
MLDPQGTGSARILHPTASLPYWVTPLLLAGTTVRGAVCVKQMLRTCTTALPQPHLVLIQDAPMRPPQDAHYRFRALGSRVAGTVTVPYLPVLRAVEEAEQALQDGDVQRAAEKPRRHMEGH